MVEPQDCSGTRVRALLSRTAAVVAFVCLAASACTEDAENGGLLLDIDRASDDPLSSDDRPVVFISESDAPGGYLDARAEPRTPLGRLRARHLPAWSADIDWAFPPDVCGSAWEFDAIAVPDPGADATAAGEASRAAALSVMRFEHMAGRAAEAPDVLAQLCVAVVSVDPTRRQLLEALLLPDRAAHDLPRNSDAVREVALVASSPAQVLAVACMQADAADDSASGARARLGAYLLALSRGIEDEVVDVSWRVARFRYSAASSCGPPYDAWARTWRDQAHEWSAEGRAWLQVSAAFTPSTICASPDAAVPAECTEDWVL